MSEPKELSREEALQWCVERPWVLAHWNERGAIPPEGWYWRRIDPNRPDAVLNRRLPVSTEALKPDNYITQEDVTRYKCVGNEVTEEKVSRCKKSPTLTAPCSHGTVGCYVHPEATRDTAPDAYCFTEPDGSCSSTDPRCMHQLKPDENAAVQQTFNEGFVEASRILGKEIELLRAQADKKVDGSVLDDIVATINAMKPPRTPVPYSHTTGTIEPLYNGEQLRAYGHQVIAEVLSILGAHRG